MWNQGIHHRTKLENKTIHTFLTAWNLIILPASRCSLIIKWPLSRRCEQNKPVMIPALLTKCWVRLGSKVSLLNPDGLLSLNCRHCLKAAEPHSWKAEFLGRHSRRGLKNSEGTQCKLLQPTETRWNSISTCSPSPAALSSCLQKWPGFLLTSSTSTLPLVSPTLLRREDRKFDMWRHTFLICACLQ